MTILCILLFFWLALAGVLAVPLLVLLKWLDQDPYSPETDWPSAWGDVCIPVAMAMNVEEEHL